MKQGRVDRGRRRVLAAGLSLAVLPAAWAASDGRRGAGLLVSGVYAGASAGISAGHGSARRAWLAWRDPAGTAEGRVTLPARGHGIALHPVRPGHVVLVNRRPGNRLWEIDLAGGTIVREVTAAAGRHFYGHGVFSRDGSLFYTTENRYQDGVGLVCVRDGLDYRVLAEIPSGGVGPHDIRLLSDDATLVVANGGIRTHPDRPRVKLDLDTMDSNLAYLDARGGAVLEQHRPPHPRLSIRHLAVSPRDEVVAVQQLEGAREDLPPLVLFHRRGAVPRPPAVDPETLLRMNYYTASVAIDAQTDTALVTCPNGNLVTLWDLRRDRLAASFDLSRPFGVTVDPAGGGYLVTAETGAIHRIDPKTGAATTAWIEGAWDNHLAFVPGAPAEDQHGA